jgi:hypothetical protein
MPLVEFGPELSPARRIGGPELRGRGRLMAGGDGRYQTYRAPNDQARRRYLASRDAPLMMARRAEEVLEVVIRPRQIGDLVARKEPEPVALGYRPEVRDCRR